jgi:methionine salvage enolase-phosphatase E1
VRNQIRHKLKEKYLTGVQGIIWATYYSYQAETIQSALMVQNISCDIVKEHSEGSHLYLLAIGDVDDVQTAIDFVWRERSGLCLQPDWTYLPGEENRSFKKWLNAK